VLGGELLAEPPEALTGVVALSWGPLWDLSLTASTLRRAA
jgi:hypothetical protein